MVKTIGCTRFLPMVNFQKRRYKWNGGTTVNCRLQAHYLKLVLGLKLLQVKLNNDDMVLLTTDS